MSIAAEVARLAAIEALCPTDCILAEGGFPTLACSRVFDSRAASVADIHGDRPTPTLAIYTRSAASRRRGESPSSASRFARTVIEIAAELSIVDQDNDGQFTSAMEVGPDPQSQMMLATLCSQVRYALTVGPTGALFRRAVKSIESVEEERMAMPELGLRWHLAVISLECEIPDDAWSENGGLPEPAASILARFPEQSPARAAMLAMAQQFSALPAGVPLAGIRFTTSANPAAPPDGSYNP